MSDCNQSIRRRRLKLRSRSRLHEEATSSRISRARCNHRAAKCYLSSRSRRVLLPSAARHAGERFCGRLVISLARYVFASRYEAHACLVSRNWHAARRLQVPAAAARFSRWIIGYNVHRRRHGWNLIAPEARPWSKSRCEIQARLTHQSTIRLANVDGCQLAHPDRRNSRHSYEHV